MGDNGPRRGGGIAGSKRAPAAGSDKRVETGATIPQGRAVVNDAGASPVKSPGKSSLGRTGKVLTIWGKLRNLKCELAKTGKPRERRGFFSVAMARISGRRTADAGSPGPGGAIGSAADL